MSLIAIKTGNQVAAILEGIVVQGLINESDTSGGPRKLVVKSGNFVNSILEQQAGPEKGLKQPLNKRRRNR